MLAELDLAGPFAPTQGAVPGTEIAGVGREALEATLTAVRHVCLRLTCVSQLAKGTAQDYRVTDTDFAGMLKAMGSGR
ncbi:hypothetical protein G4X40_09250 [Rhodococcus sp. D2-41]|nr:hypothetical protein [Rhodococcus sp. D2-41]MDG3010338.1 hypothetical protein [Rhodococcus sp. D2-41]